MKIQTELKAPKNQYNSFGKYKFRNCEDILEAVKPHLKEHGLNLLLSDEVVNVGQHNYVKATAVLTDGQADIQVSAFARESESRKGMDDSQITGATSSYARKYALNGLFAIDDTKDADSKEPTKAEPKAQPKKTTQPDLATEKQRNLISDKLGAIGFTTPDQIKHYLATEYGINGLLTKEDAGQVIEDLISGGSEQNYNE